MGTPTPDNRPEHVLRVFSQLDRVRVLHVLRTRHLTVSDLTEILRVLPSRVERQLRYLRDAGLVTARKSGLENVYSLAPAEGPWHRRIWRCIETCLEELPEIRADTARARDFITGQATRGNAATPGGPSRQATEGGKARRRGERMLQPETVPTDFEGAST
jgi:DNA-binding transcriptional ArsR family regulator